MLQVFTAKFRWCLRGAIVIISGFAFSALPAKGERLSSAEFRNVLMPQPSSMTVSTGEFELTASWGASIEGVQSDRLSQAVLRMIDRVRRLTALPISAAIVPGHTAPLIIHADREGELVQDTDEDESYSLEVTSSGVRIDAPTVVGAMHGLQTLVQLVQPSGDNYVLPLVTIRDFPRFRWRGLMIDCGRHFEPVAVIERMLDGMAAVKMNVFHWHLTEDQGFRIQSQMYPNLTAKGSDGLFYTQDDAREIVRYAHDRGIRVVPEFEMPGHSTAWLVAYPELSSGKIPAGIRREFGISDLALDPTREETYTFITNFIAEMTKVFPDPYVHIGGDETQAADWKSNPRILEFMSKHELKDADALQAYFNQRILTILTTFHKRMIGWDEILNPALPKDVIVQSWRGEESLIKSAKQGYKGVLSAPYYLDGMRTAEQHYLADPLPMTADLTPQQRTLILGGEVCMWGEQLDEHTIDSRVWPRTAAIAERFWSPEQVRDVDDMYRRLDAVSVELEGLGLQHLSQQDVGLRQLTGVEDIRALRLVASVLEPVSFSDRYHQQRTSQTTVLDLFVDAVRPDPPSRREFAKLTSAFLQNPTTNAAAGNRLTVKFTELSAAVPDVREQIKLSPRLRNIQSRTEQLADLASAGIEAIQYLSAGVRAPEGWKSHTADLVKRANQPSGIVRFTFLSSLIDLFDAVRE